MFFICKLMFLTSMAHRYTVVTVQTFTFSSRKIFAQRVQEQSAEGKGERENPPANSAIVMRFFQLLF